MVTPFAFKDNFWIIELTVHGLNPVFGLAPHMYIVDLFLDIFFLQSMRYLLKFSDLSPTVFYILLIAIKLVNPSDNLWTCS